ncbi:Proton-dependent oligopeptide transporter family [Dillenia turbinata]|uniref:Proton-dependent oligopeptide transporter family n=1 Tax=Dillenia turbinata TaxID=194707 RepID=A0AAN8VGU5_9MAGN
MAERFSYYAIAGNLIQYLTKEFGEPVVAAAKHINIWLGVSSLFPILGGLIADSYLGRFNTILISTFIFLLGLVLLTLSVATVPLHIRPAVFYSSLYIFSIGEGGHKPCVQTFAADQFDEDSEEEKKKKSTFFNWWYAGIVVGSSTAVLVAVYLQDNVSWTVGFSLPTVVVALALVVFLLGTRGYCRSVLVGSPFTKVAQVFVAAARKRHLSENLDGGDVCQGQGEAKIRSLARNNQFSFLDKATIIDAEDASSKTRNNWRLCSVNQVEETKLILRLVPIWFSVLPFSVINAQHGTFFTKQGNSLDRSLTSKFAIPAASLQFFTGVTILISLIIYDRLFVPLMRKLTGHPSGITMLQRIGVGIFTSTICMVIAALVEAKRVSVALEHGLINNPKATLPMSVFWLLPQYMLLGVSDVFAIIGMQELFYTQVHEDMRSIGAAAFLTVTGIGNFLSTAVITIVQLISSKLGNQWLGYNLNQAHLHGFYLVLAAMCALSLCMFVWFSKGFIYKELKSEDAGEDRDSLEEGKL